MDLHHSNHEKVLMDIKTMLLSLIIVAVLTALLFYVKKAEASNDQIKTLQTHLTHIFDAEVLEASVECIGKPKGTFLVIKYFPDYLYDCDDSSVIGGENDPDYHGEKDESKIPGLVGTSFTK